jgi:hypothetical protein
VKFIKVQFTEVMKETAIKEMLAVLIRDMVLNTLCALGGFVITLTVFFAGVELHVGVMRHDI